MSDAAAISKVDRAGAPASARDFITLLKPRVMSLVVFTALTGLVCAERPMNPILAAIAILCIAIGAGAAGARTPKCAAPAPAPSPPAG
jgi:protoheme IX farnesyltransferase